MRTAICWLLNSTVLATCAVAQGSAPQWTSYVAPSIPGSTLTVISEVEGSAPNDVWAVGSYTAPLGGSFPTTSIVYPLVLHFDGVAWTQVSTPVTYYGSGPGTVNAFQSVRALAPNDVWVGGYFQTTLQVPFGSQGYLPYVLHWDGSTWTQVTLPAPYAGSGGTVAEIVGTATDLWFLGDALMTGASGSQSLAVHYDGTNFTQYSVPFPVGLSVGGEIGGGAYVASNDVWAVGGPGGIGGAGLTATPYVRRWTGTAWTVVTAPSGGTGHILSDVAAASPADVWACGGVVTSASSTQQPFFLRWNGSVWAVAPAAGTGSGLNIEATANGEIMTTGLGGAWVFSGSSWNLEAIPGPFTQLFVAQFGRAGTSTWAIASDIGVTPPQRYLLERAIPSVVAAQSFVRTPCAGIAPPLGLSAILAPTVGNTAIVEVGDPNGVAALTPGGTFTYWICSGAPAPNAPCGLLIPGAGFGGQPAELLVDLSPGAYAIVDSPKIWGGPSLPAWHTLTVPPIAGLAGFPFFTQAVLVDYAVVPPHAVLTSALDFIIGS